ncbi:MAG: DUF1836 domain-containing protein [Lachnospiraceae bacterium]|nr:DUF1836 domain-containing protein [Lachnospiraceae bacterium]
MTIDTKDLLNSILASFDRMTYIKSEDVPGIDLYMDQVTTFMDERLKKSTRNQTEEKLMTKTMINNYAKNDVIPPPDRKKYNKEHILILIMVYYFKSILQINDIKELMDPIIDKFFDNRNGFAIEDVYDEIFSDMDGEISRVRDEIVAQYSDAMTKFEDAPDADKDYLKLYSFVCKLGCDVFVKKLLIEKIVDSLREQSGNTRAKSGKSKDKDNKYDVNVDKKSKKQ